MRYIPSYGDGDFSWEKLDAVYNSDLANELGNAVQRTTAMIQKYQDGVIGDIPAASHDTAQYRLALEQCHFDKALDLVWDQVRGINQYIDTEKPWAIAKTNDTEHLQEVLAYITSSLLEIASMLEPFMPSTAVKIKNVFSAGVVRPIEGTLFPKFDTEPKAVAPKV